METPCSRCGAEITCSPEGDCWCVELPHGPMPDSMTTEQPGCLCRNCLEERFQEFKLKRNDTTKICADSLEND